MNRYVTELLNEALEAKRQREALRDLILTDFVLEEGSMVRRGVLHSMVAKRMGRSVSNSLCLAIKEAIFEMPGVHQFKRNGSPFYRNLRLRA